MYKRAHTPSEEEEVRTIVRRKISAESELKIKEFTFAPDDGQGSPEGYTTFQRYGTYLYNYLHGYYPPVRPYFNIVNQGSDEYTCTGNQIKEVGLRIKGNVLFYKPVTTRMESSAFRLLLIRERHCGNGVAFMDDIFAGPGMGAGDSRRINTMLNWTNRKRFSVIADKTFDCHASTTADEIPLMRTSFEFNVDLNNILTFNNEYGSDDVKRLPHGGIFMVAVADHPVTFAYPDNTNTQICFEGQFTFRDI